MKRLDLIASIFVAATLHQGCDESALHGEAGAPQPVAPVVKPGTGSGPGAKKPFAFNCDQAADLFTSDVRRLSKTQFVNSIADLLTETLGAVDAKTVTAALANDLALIPDDTVTEDADYRRMNQTVSQSHVNGYWGVARKLGAELVKTPARIEAVVGKCATDSDTTNDAKCLADFLRRFTTRVFRRPVRSQELTFLRDTVYNKAAHSIDGTEDVLTVLFSAPDFIYALEYGAAPVDATKRHYKLTAHELASRLAYHFWQSGPDAKLLAAAADASLLTASGYKAQVDRLVADVRTERAIDAFYAQWLHLDRVPKMDANVKRADFIAYAGADLPNAQLTKAIVDDVKDLLRYYTWTKPGGLDGVLQSKLSFARTANVAKLYGGVPLWDGKATPPTHVEPGRTGLLSRLALLVNNQAITRPILRGAFVVKRLLCRDINLPDMMNDVRFEPATTKASTRKRVEQLTEAPGSRCSGCHALVNPFGFVAENYDALGRSRRSETLFSPVDGKRLGEVPIDTKTTLNLTGFSGTKVSSVAELSRVILDSGEVHACLARHYFRFTFARKEDVKRDGCILEQVRKGVADDGTLKGMLKAVAHAPAFSQIRKAK